MSAATAKNTSKKFYLTTPIYYVNARPHIGHAYTTIVADVLARRSRAQGQDTWFLTGTDEHGQKIERSAAAAGIPPQQFTDQVSATFREPWRRMGITNNDFIRTTEPRHKQGVQKLFKAIQDAGYIYLNTYTGAYCVSDEAFVDVNPGDPCPECGNPTETLSESNYYFRLSAFESQILQLIESNTLVIQPETLRNEVLSFVRSGLKDLSISRTSITWGIPVPGDPAHVIYVWLDALANYMTAVGYGSDKPEDIAKFNRFWPADLHLIGKEIARFHCVYWPAFLLAANLPLPKTIAANGWLLFQDTKMSKSKGNVVRIETILDAFGPLCPPAPPLRSEADSSAPGISSGLQPAENGQENSGASAPGSPSPTPNPVILSERSESKDPDTAHPTTTAGTFPAQSLKAPTTAPVSLKGTASAVPQTTPNDSGALAPEGISKAQQDLFASDVLRYFLLREIPFGQDGSFTFDAMVTRYNADLANGYGNLVSRTFAMIQKRGGSIPADHATAAFDPDFTARDVISYGTIRAIANEAEEDIARLAFTAYLAKVASLVTLVDGYITQFAPWKLTSSTDPVDQKKAELILYTAAESIRIITLLLYPIMPFSTAAVWRQLGLGDIELTTNHYPLSTLLQWGGLKPGTKLGPLAPIFPRADKGLIDTMIQLEQDKNTPIGHANAAHDASENTHSEFKETSLASATATPVAAPPTTHSPLPTTHCTIDDFAKIELRVAKILVAERIPKADKLLRLEVDLGYEKRQILSGIAEFYTPEELIGRRIVVISNLAPRKMRGLESHGMLLAASDGDHGKPILATFPDADEIPLGSRLK